MAFLDNGSNDGSAALAGDLLSEADISHSIMVNDAPANIPANLNRLISVSDGQLVAFLSADDWYAPRYVQAMLAAADAFPDAGLFYAGGWIYRDDTGKLEPIDTHKHRSGDLYLPLLRREDPIFFVGTCVRRAAFEAIGGFDEQLRIDDLDFFVRLAQRFPIQQVPEQLVYYRRFGEAISSNIPWMIEGWEQFYAKHHDAQGVDMRWWMAETYRNYAAAAIDQGDTALARTLLARALRLKPFALSAWRTAAYLLRQNVVGRSGISPP